MRFFSRRFHCSFVVFVLLVVSIILFGSACGDKKGDPPYVLQGIVASGPVEVDDYSGMPSSALAPLSNNTIALVYTHGGGDFGKLIIYDSDAQALTGKIPLMSNDINYLSAAPLGNNNILIAYIDSENLYKGKYVIYDKLGNRITDEDPDQPVFDDISCRDVSLAGFSNGSAAIVYRRNVSGDRKGYFAMMNAGGDTLTGPWSFDDIDVTTGISATSLDTGNLFVAFNSLPRYAIHETDGDTVTADSPDQPSFEADSVDYFNTALLTGGNVVIAYSDEDDSGKGKFAIYNSSGTCVTAADPDQPVFSSTDVEGISVTGLQDGRFLIAYKDIADVDKGKFMVYNADGTVSITATTFEAGELGISSIKSATLSGGYVALMYSLNTNGGSGHMILLK